MNGDAATSQEGSNGSAAVADELIGGRDGILQSRGDAGGCVFRQNGVDGSALAIAGDKTGMF